MKTILGLDRLDEVKALFEGKRIGLITNYSGVDSGWKMNVDLFMEKGLRLAKIFTPEHGMFGEGAGKPVGDDVYPGYGIPIISLFGDHVRPGDSDLDGIDIMVYDIQDVGLRYYTYISVSYTHLTVRPGQPSVNLADQIRYAVLVVSMVPMLAVYPFVQKYFVKGVTLGAVKG